MIPCVRLLVHIEDFVPWADDERCTKLHRTVPGLVLPMAPEQRLSAGQKCVGTDERCRFEPVHLDDPCCFTVFVNENLEGNVLVFDERLRVPLPSGADGGDARAGLKDLFVPLTDLTGPFPARQSAKVAEEEENMSLIDPQVTEAVQRAFRIGQ